MKTLCSLITLSAIVFLLRASPAIAQKQPVKMTVSYSAAGGQYINLFVAKEFGVFEKHGLEVTLNQINSSSQAVAALRSKSVDVATGPAGVIFDAIAKGVTDFMMFGECMPATVLEVWVQPNIKSVKDLVGKTISSTNPNSLGDLMIGVWLARNGIKKSDVNVVYLGGLGNLISAMKANKTDATLILPPLGEQLLPSGQKRFGDLRDIISSNQAWTTTNGRHRFRQTRKAEKPIGSTQVRWRDQRRVECLRLRFFYASADDHAASDAGGGQGDPGAFNRGGNAQAQLKTVHQQRFRR